MYASMACEIQDGVSVCAGWVAVHHTTHLQSLEAFVHLYLSWPLSVKAFDSIESFTTADMISVIVPHCSVSPSVCDYFVNMLSCYH